ncbi:MAG: dihydrofolate reductase family protein [Acidimicrobiia bacterium]|nr:dihydrofolate reductase family protein [Acidimicrobiia bacterium]
MRIVVSEFMSLDGVIQAPGGAGEDTDGGFAHGGWSMPFFHPETMGVAMDRVLTNSDALLFGRRTWETMAAAWPERAGDPFADRMNSIPKHVASRSLAQSDLNWENSMLLEGDAITAVGKLKARPGGNMLVMGSSNLVQQLIAAELVDEYLLMIEPVVLGGGKRLFPDDASMRPLDLVEQTTTPTGVQICSYRPTGGVRIRTA